MKLFRNDRPLTPSWDLVRPSLKLVQENIWPLFYLAFLPSLVSIVGLVLASQTNITSTTVIPDNRTYIGLVLTMLGILASIITYPGVIYLMTRAVQGEQPTAGESFKAGIPRIIPFFMMTLVEAIALTIGFLILIVPGLIMLRGFLLAPYYLIDQKLGPIESLKKSFNDSKTNAGYIWGTIGVLVVFGFLGSAVGRLPVIGYLLSLAAGYIYVFAPALRYAEIAKHIKVEVDSTSDTPAPKA